MKGLRNHNSLQGSLDPRRQLSKLSKYTLIYLGCLSVSLCFHDFMQELTRTWCPTCIEARLRTLKIFLPGGIHCNNIWKNLHTSSLDDSVMAFSFFLFWTANWFCVLQFYLMNLRVKSSTLAMEKYQVIHGQTSSHWLPALSLWLTTTIVKAILIVKGRKQRQKSPSATEAKINLLAFKAQWHLVTTILLRMKPGPPVPQESHLYQSFFSRAASTKFTIVLINN